MTAVDLQGLQLLDEFTPQELDLLRELLQERELDSGDILFQEGSMADGLYWVADGQLSLSQRKLGEIGSATVGDALGVLSLIAMGKREATAVAAAHCLLYYLDRHGYHRLLEDAPRAICKLHESFLKDFGEAVRESMLYSAGSVDRG